MRIRLSVQRFNKKTNKGGVRELVELSHWRHAALRSPDAVPPGGVVTLVGPGGRGEAAGNVCFSHFVFRSWDGQRVNASGSYSV